MAAPARTPLTHLPKGHRFPPTTVELTEADVADYLAAVDDANSIYRERGLAPPLAVAARALGALLETIELPAGTLHTGQEMETRSGVPLGAALALRGSIVQRSERAEMVVSVIEFEVTPDAAQDAAIVGRTTVVAPAGGAS